MWIAPAAISSFVQSEMNIDQLVKKFMPDHEQQCAPDAVTVKEPEIDLSDLSFEDGELVWFIK